jgi:Ran GTPase-activating protein (RanGAP) involved in mRNA processing and transport
MLEELELNEADINMESLDVIMEALYKADHLRRLSLSKNCLDEGICQHLSDLPSRLHNFQSLCLSHCEIGLDALDNLCKGFYGQTTIKCLDLSWNNISS